VPGTEGELSTTILEGSLKSPHAWLITGIRTNHLEKCSPTAQGKRGGENFRSVKAN